MADREHYAITAAVWFGNLVLIGGVTVAIVDFAIDVALQPVGSPASGWITVVQSLIALSIGIYTANEVTRVRLHGLQELRRGSPRRALLRHGILAVPAVTVMLWFGYAIVDVATEGSDVAGFWGLALLAAAAPVFAYSAIRTIESLQGGRRDALAGPEVASDRD